MAFSPDGGQIATAAPDQVVHLWDIRSGRELRELKCESKILAIVFSPDGTWLTTANTGWTPTLWAVSTGDARMWLTHDGTVRGVAFSPDSKWLATASSDGTAKIWDSADVRPRPSSVTMARYEPWHAAGIASSLQLAAQMEPLACGTCHLPIRSH